MKRVDSTTGFDGIGHGWAVTIGNFDGVHLGHREILRRAGVAARANHAVGVAVITFDPHPVAVLHSGRGPGIITPMPLKERLLEQNGVDCLAIVKDGYRLFNLSPKDFVDDFLGRYFRPKVMIEGGDFHFGYGRSGTIDTLRQLGAERDFSVVAVESFDVRDLNGKRIPCSSTLIRHHLDCGEVRPAADMLGRPYRLMGQTVPGRGIGTQLGFPTANIQPLDQIIPAEGVYAGWVTVADDPESLCGQKADWPSVFSIGRAKTFVTDHPLLLEAHILDQNPGDLHGRWLAMDFVQRIRDQRRFDSREALAQQIAVDCRIAHTMLAEKDKD